MLQHMRGTAPRNCNRVEPVFCARGRVLAEPCARDVRDLASFCPGDRVQRVATIGSCPGFDFDESDSMPEAGDYVHFLVTGAEVTCKDAPTPRPQIVTGDFFRSAAEIV
jgi:hypothetical protein